MPTAEAAASVLRGRRRFSQFFRNRTTAILAAALAAAGMCFFWARGPEAVEEKLARVRTRLAEDPGDMSALYEAGRLEFLRGPASYAAAASYFERAREAGLTDPRLFYYLGSVYQGLGLYDFAAEEYRRYLNNKPGDLEVRLSLAKLSYQKGDYAAAEDAFSGLAEERPRDPVVLENLALASWKNGGAWAEPLAGLRELGGTPAARADLVEGLINHASGDHARAAELLARAAGSPAAVPDRTELLRKLADSRRSLKDEAGAAAALRELLALSPGDKEAASLLPRLERAAARKKK